MERRNNLFDITATHEKGNGYAIKHQMSVWFPTENYKNVEDMKSFLSVGG